MKLRASAILDPQGRQVMVAEPTYRNAGGGRRFVGLQAPLGMGSNAALLPHLETLRSRARALVRNDPLVWNAIECLVANHVGWGAIPTSEADTPEARTALDRTWADSARQMGFDQKQVTACREVFTAGEVFLRLRDRFATDTDRHGRRLLVPMDVQVLEAEHCPVSKTGIENGNRVRAGIEFNAIGERVAYWMYREHPGDGVPFRDTRDLDLVRIPASEILHLYVREAPGQLRGIPRAARVVLSAHNLDQSIDATLQKQLIAALFAGFITQPDAGGTNAMLGADDDEDEPTLEPGSLSYLAPGEKIEFPDPPDVGPNLATFIDLIYRRLGTGLGVMFEQLTGDLSNVNFTSYRAGHLEFRRRCQMFQYATFEPELLEPVWVRWVRRAVLALPELQRLLPNFTRNEVAAERVRWVYQGWPYVNPQQEGAAAAQRILDGLTTQGDEIRELGGNPERRRLERKDELDANRKAGLRDATDPEVAQPRTAATSPSDTPVEEPPARQPRRRSAARTRRAATEAVNA